MVGYLNRDLARYMPCDSPIRYVDVDDAELRDYPTLVEAVAQGLRPPLVLVGDEVKKPGVLTRLWIEDQLDLLDSDSPAAFEGGDI
jgi:hypothetical protein